MESQMKDLPTQSNNKKQMHGCVITWLVLEIISNLYVSILYLVSASHYREWLALFPKPLLTINEIMLILNIVFYILLLWWKKIGFWGISVLTLVSMVLNISYGFNVAFSIIVGFSSIIILFAILQIKRNGVSAWNNME